MGFYQVDMLGKAKPIYLRCPFCKNREWLRVRRVEWLGAHGDLEQRFSVHCLSCRLNFGEVSGEPQYESESELIADWNRRAY